MANQKNTSGTGKKVAVGIAMVAAAAGAYFLYGTEAGKKTSKKIKGWALKAKGEVLEKLENLKEVSQEKYDSIVEAVSSKYQKVKNVDQAELATMIKELKGHWKNIKKQLK
jgi:hypothetical protein